MLPFRRLAFGNRRRVLHMSRNNHDPTLSTISAAGCSASARLPSRAPKLYVRAFPQLHQSPVRQTQWARNELGIAAQPTTVRLAVIHFVHMTLPERAAPSPPRLRRKTTTGLPSYCGRATSHDGRVHGCEKSREEVLPPSPVRKPVDPPNEHSGPKKHSLRNRRPLFRNK